MSNRTRAIIGVLVALMLTCGVLAGLIYLLAGDQLTRMGRVLLARAALAARQDELNTPAGTSTDPVRFVVNTGESPAVIGQRLEAENLIIDSQLFLDYLRAESLDVELEAGTFFVNPAQTIPEIALSLTDSRFSQITLTIPPGWRIEQLVEAIDANPLFAFSGSDFLTVISPGAAQESPVAARVGLPATASLEGFLYPDTYSLPPEVTPEQLRDILTESFLAAVDEPLFTAAEGQGLSMFEVVTLASIVQREAFHADEKPLIAGVYLNRLAIGMKLDADPTVQYGLGKERGEWWTRITVADYQGVNSRYNTYIYNGLPPGPINSPSLEAIRAVISPEASPYYYFRADCRSDGYHDFAETYAEHLENGC